MDDAGASPLRGRATGRLRPDAARPRQPGGARHRHPRHDRRRRHAVLLAGPGQRRASRSWRSPRRWTTTSRAPSTASASRRRSPAPRRRSTASGRRSAATSGSASSGSSAAMPGSRRCTRPTSPRPAASSRRRPTTSTRWPRCWPRTTPANPSHYAFVITAEGAIWQGAQMADVGDADAFGHRHKANVGEALATELRERTGIETLASELTYDLRSGEPDSIDSMVATTFANVAMDLVESGVTGRMVAIQDGKYAHTHPARPGARPAQGRRPGDVQRRAVPAALRRQARRPDAAGRARLTDGGAAIRRLVGAYAVEGRQRRGWPAPGPTCRRRRGRRRSGRSRAGRRVR